MIEPSSIPMYDTNDVQTAPMLTEEERKVLEADLKQTQDEISDLRHCLSLKLQHENELKHKLGITLIETISHDLKSGIKTIKDSNTYHKTAEVLATAKDKTTHVVYETKDLVSKKLADAKQTNTYKEVEQRVGNMMNSMKDAFFFAAYGPPPISDEEYEEAISATPTEKSESTPEEGAGDKQK